MKVETYIALLHDDQTPTPYGRPVLCPFQPDGTPKPAIDHHGSIYHLNDHRGQGNTFDYVQEAIAP